MSVIDTIHRQLADATATLDELRREGWQQGQHMGVLTTKSGKRVGLDLLIDLACDRMSGEIWAVFRQIPGTNAKEFRGVFTNQFLAENECRDGSWFVVPVRTNVAIYPHQYDPADAVTA